MKQIHKEQREGAVERYEKRGQSAMWVSLVVVAAGSLFAGISMAWMALTFIQLAHLFIIQASWMPLILAMGVAMMIAGPFFWWLLILRTARLTQGRAIGAGILAGLLAHPLMWLLIGMTSQFMSTGTIIPDEVMMLQLWMNCGVSLTYGGVLSALVGAAMGRLLADFIRRLTRQE